MALIFALAGYWVGAVITAGTALRLSLYPFGHHSDNYYECPCSDRTTHKRILERGWYPPTLALVILLWPPYLILAISIMVVLRIQRLGIAQRDEAKILKDVPDKMPKYIDG